MRYTWIDEFLLNKRGVTKDLQESWNWIRYQVGGKMFAAICLDWEDKPYYINLKLEPVEGEFLRSQYPDIVPGYYSNKEHWNSVKPDGEVPDELLKDLLDKSYRLVLEGFGKKRQREILGLTCCGTECAACGAYGSMCQGCNETNGKVFHAPEGEACAIYRCSVNKCKFTTCAACGKLPCDIWLATRDPAMTKEQFDASVRERVEKLKAAAGDDLPTDSY